MSTSHLDPETANAATPGPPGAPVSLNQQFVALFDSGDRTGPFGPRYHLVHGWRVQGRVDTDALRAALRDVTARHESLRTRIDRTDDGYVQLIRPVTDVDLEIRRPAAVPEPDRDAVIDGLLDEMEAGTIAADALPLLRARLVCFDDSDALLMIMAHHLATDGWSMRLIMRDVAHCYAVRRGFPAVALPAVRQYTEYAVWQRTLPSDEHDTWWRAQLTGVRAATIATDRPRSAGAPPGTAVHRFLLDKRLVDLVSQLARDSRSTGFMVLFGAFALQLHQRDGGPDVTVPTFTHGRGTEAEGFHEMVGSCFNFLPVRVPVGRATTFRELVTEVRAACIDSYRHDIPAPRIFAQAAELMADAMTDDRAPMVFQLFPFPFLLDRTAIGDLRYTEVRRHLTSTPVASDVPDGTLWTLNNDASGDMIGSVQYRTELYDASTVRSLVDDYVGLLERAVSAPTVPLQELRPAGRIDREGAAQA